MIFCAGMLAGWLFAVAMLAIFGSADGCLLASLRSVTAIAERAGGLMADISAILEAGWPQFAAACVACGQVPGSLADYVFGCQSAVRQLWAVVYPPACVLAAEFQTWLADCGTLVADMDVDNILDGMDCQVSFFYSITHVEFILT